MKKALLAVVALSALAACRESNTTVQRAPSAQSITPSKTLSFDTTFAQPAQQPRAYSYTANITVGSKKTVVVPVQIDWTTVEEHGCPQVASLRIYQLGESDTRNTILVKVQRDTLCKKGPLPVGPGKAATGAAYVNLTCHAKAVRAFTSFRFTLNGLGYHDNLEPLLTINTPSDGLPTTGLSTAQHVGRK